SGESERRTDLAADATRDLNRTTESAHRGTDRYQRGVQVHDPGGGRGDHQGHRPRTLEAEPDPVRPCRMGGAGDQRQEEKCQSGQLAPVPEDEGVRGDIDHDRTVLEAPMTAE